MANPRLDISSPHATGRIDRGQVRRSATAEIVCAERAAETWRPADRRLIDDPYAQHFISKPGYRLLCATRATSALTRTVFDRRFPGFLAIVLLRNRWHEELLARALADGVDQVVLLGAGYDTTGLRLELGDARLFEVDAAPTQQSKREIIRRKQLPTRADITYVPCDFERDSLPQRLIEAGFDPGKPALIAWWGVSFFLTEQAVRATVRDVAELSAPGSLFTFDYVDASVIARTTRFVGALRALDAVSKRGEPYHFGMSLAGAERFVRSYGFDVEANLSVTELASRYAGKHGFPYSTDDFFSVMTARKAAQADL